MLATDPKATYKVTPFYYKELPENEQPVFEFKYMSVREWKKCSAISDKFETCKSGAEGIDIAIAIIKPNLVDWQNVTDSDGNQIEFDPELIEDIFTPGEITELMQWVINQTPNVEDKKKSESRSDSATNPETAKIAPE